MKGCEYGEVGGWCRGLGLINQQPRGTEDSSGELFLHASEKK